MFKIEKNYLRISKNLNEYYNPGSSGANALQIGIMKGYKRIVLLGCDCKYVEILKEAKLDSNNKLQIVKTVLLLQAGMVVVHWASGSHFIQVIILLLFFIVQVG